MANKIVQLTDKDGNNLFPVVGADVPTIEMTDTDPGEGASLAENHYVAVYGGDPIILDYSTNEVNTGTKWIDGSAIYKKTISFGSLPNSAQKSVAHGITNLGNFVKGIEAFMVQGQHIWSLPYTSVTIVEATATDVIITDTSDLSAFDAYVTVYYTKSA